MSNPCRRFHTTFGCYATKLLIRLAGCSVAEGRQATRFRTRSDIAPGGRREVGGSGKEAPGAWSEYRRSGAKGLPNNAFYNAYCRSFSTLHRRHTLFYTPAEIRLRFSMNGSVTTAGAGKQVRGLGCRSLTDGHSEGCDAVNGMRPESQST